MTCAYCTFPTPENDRLRLPGIRGDFAHAACAYQATLDAMREGLYSRASVLLKRRINPKEKTHA